MYDGPGDTTPQLREYLGILQRHREQLEGQRRDIDDTLAEIATQEKACRDLLDGQA